MTKIQIVFKPQPIMKDGFEDGQELVLEQINLDDGTIIEAEAIGGVWTGDGEWEALNLEVVHPGSKIVDLAATWATLEDKPCTMGSRIGLTMVGTMVHEVCFNGGQVMRKPLFPTYIVYVGD